MDGVSGRNNSSPEESKACTLRLNKHHAGFWCQRYISVPTQSLSPGSNWPIWTQLHFKESQGV